MAGGARQGWRGGLVVFESGLGEEADIASGEARHEFAFIAVEKCARGWHGDCGGEFDGAGRADASVIPVKTERGQCGAFGEIPDDGGGVTFRFRRFEAGGEDFLVLGSHAERAGVDSGAAGVHQGGGFQL